MTGATIILGGQSFKDKVLEKVPYGRSNAVTIKMLHQAHFTDHHPQDVQDALQTLRHWPGLVECDFIKIPGKRREVVYWRQA